MSSGVWELMRQKWRLLRFAFIGFGLSILLAVPASDALIGGRPEYSETHLLITLVLIVLVAFGLAWYLVYARGHDASSDT